MMIQELNKLRTLIEQLIAQLENAKAENEQLRNRIIARERELSQARAQISELKRRQK